MGANTCKCLDQKSNTEIKYAKRSSKTIQERGKSIKISISSIN